MAQLSPLHANPGGQLAADEIVGREALAQEILETLERRSIVLTGERRLGKTTLTTLLGVLAPQRGWSLVKVSVEGLETREEFESLLGREIELAGRSAAAKKATAAKRNIDGAKVAGVSVKPSRPSLDEVIDSAMKRVDERLLLVLDELPIFVRSADDRSPGSGTNVLNRLRRIREDRHVRMLMLGSIGFHHTVKDATGVLNEVDKRRLGALDSDDALELASRLLVGEGFGGTEVPTLAAEVAEQADFVPYYIHSIVEAAKRQRGGSALTPERIDQIVEGHLASPDWNMRHFRDRIPRYYGPGARLATASLDAIAHERELNLESLSARLNTDESVAPVEQTTVRDMLTTLEDDHYLVRDAAGNRRFAFELVRRAWVATGR